jgi:hypothetical protein
MGSPSCQSPHPTAKTSSSDFPSASPRLCVSLPTALISRTQRRRKKMVEGRLRSPQASSVPMCGVGGANESVEDCKVEWQPGPTHAPSSTLRKAGWYSRVTLSEQREWRRKPRRDSMPPRGSLPILNLARWRCCRRLTYEAHQHRDCQRLL